MKAYGSLEVQLQSLLTWILDDEYEDHYVSCRVEKNLLLLFGIKPHFLGHPVYQFSYPGSYFYVLLLDIMLCLAHFMKLNDYHNAILSKLLCFTEGTELLERCVLERGYKIFKDSHSCSIL